MGATVVGFAVPASAHGATTTYAPCNCSTTTSGPSTSTTLPATTTTAAGTTTVASTSPTGVSTTTIYLVPPVTATAPPGSVVEQGSTTTTNNTATSGDTTTTRDGAETVRLPHTGSSPFFPVTFGLGSLTVGAVLALRRKPREWYGS